MIRRDENQIVGLNSIEMKVSFREYYYRNLLVRGCTDTTRRPVASRQGSKEVDRIKVVHVETTNSTPSSRGKMGFQPAEVSFCSMIRNELDAHGYEIEQ